MGAAPAGRDWALRFGVGMLLLAAAAALSQVAWVVLSLMAEPCGAACPWDRMAVSWAIAQWSGPVLLVAAGLLTLLPRRGGRPWWLPWLALAVWPLCLLVAVLVFGDAMQQGAAAPG